MAKINKEKALVAIGPLPPPHTGQSISFQMLLDELQGKSERVIPVDIAIAEAPDQSKLAGLMVRTLSFFQLAVTVFPIFYRYDCRVYLTISQALPGFLRDYLIIMLASWFKHPVVAHLKGGNYDGFYYNHNRIVRWMIRKMLRKAETLIVLSKMLSRMYWFDLSLGDRVVVVENGLPFHKEPSLAKKLPVEQIDVLFLSNLIESKGYLDLLDAIALCKDHSPPVHVHYAGNFQTSTDDILVKSVSHAKELFENKVRYLGIEDKVTYHDVVIGEEKINLLERCHLLALPTRYIYEGQPVSIIEALGFGMPIISTDYRGINDMVIDKQTGVLMHLTKPKDIADAILYIADPSRYQQMSQACLDLFNKKFTREAHLKRLLKHL
jgi:glycosyltransferase involved in cell wall biosynthesis